jgi:AcrR family transcriptional regulator
MFIKLLTGFSSTMSQPNSPAESASARRRAQAREDLRAKILATAAELFVERGYEGMAMRQLAERIGYTAATIYLHFASKDDLLFALLDQGYNNLAAQLAAVDAQADHADPIGRLEAIGRAYIAFGMTNPTYYQLMFMRRADFLQAKLAERGKNTNVFAILGDPVAAAMAAGALQPGDPITISLALWSVVHGLVSLLITVPGFEPALQRALIDTTISTFLSGLTYTSQR